MGSTTSHRRRPLLALFPVLLAALALALLPAPAAQARGPLVPPAQPRTGLGAAGPCGVAAQTHVNPADPAQKITIYNPTGRAAAPFTGGHCDDARRPVAVVVHGLLAGIDGQLLGPSVLYADLIRHLTSTGNVVVFATWPTNPYDFGGSFVQADRAVAAAQRFAPRGDFSRLGIVGHSMGGAATPHLAQQAVARGWGEQALWLFQLAPAFAANVGTGPLTVPPHTRVVVQNYSDDVILDTRIGIEQFEAYSLPATHKQHVLVRSESRGPLASLSATHLSPSSVLAPEDAIRFFGIYRIGDALQACALTGRHCTADLSYMGRWSDGRPVRRALSTDRPVDAGPPAKAFAVFGLEGECDNRANERRANCGPSRR